MLFTSSQLLMLTLTLLSVSSLHSCWCALLSWHLGLHTGKEHLVQGNMGVLMGARQEGQTGEVIIGGPERTALSTRIVSLALIGLVAIRPLPFPCHHAYMMYISSPSSSLSSLPPPAPPSGGNTLCLACALPGGPHCSSR